MLCFWVKITFADQQMTSDELSKDLNGNVISSNTRVISENVLKCA